PPPAAPPALLAAGLAADAPAPPSVFPGRPATERPALSLHAALPVHRGGGRGAGRTDDRIHAVLGDQAAGILGGHGGIGGHQECPDRKSTRLNSSPVKITYAVSGFKNKDGGWMPPALQR